MDKIIQILQSMPKWARIVCITLLVIALGFGVFFSVPSCSSVRATLNGDGKLSTSVNHSIADSVNVSVSVSR